MCFQFLNKITYTKIKCFFPYTLRIMTNRTSPFCRQSSNDFFSHSSFSQIKHNKTKILHITKKWKKKTTIRVEIHRHPENIHWNFEWYLVTTELSWKNIRFFFWLCVDILKKTIFFEPDTILMHLINSNPNLRQSNLIENYGQFVA